jgi:hypothetical protein
MLANIDTQALQRVAKQAPDGTTKATGKAKGKPTRLHQGLGSRWSWKAPGQPRCPSATVRAIWQFTRCRSLGAAHAEVTTTSSARPPRRRSRAPRRRRAGDAERRRARAAAEQSRLQAPTPKADPTSIFKTTRSTPSPIPRSTTPSVIPGVGPRRTPPPLRLAPGEGRGGAISSILGGAVNVAGSVLPIDKGRLGMPEVLQRLDALADTSATGVIEGSKGAYNIVKHQIEHDRRKTHYLQMHRGRARGPQAHRP